MEDRSIMEAGDGAVVVKKGVLENFMLNQQNSLKFLFQRKRKSPSQSHSPSNDEDSPAISPKHIPQLSAVANSVVARCSKILKISTEELQHRYDIELPESVKQLLTYARHFVEFCSFQTLTVMSRTPDYLSDPDFRRLTFDMMLAWETPSVECESDNKESPSSSNHEEEDEDGLSIFYSSSTNMAVQVGDNKTVGPEAFARIAPVCAAVADLITVHNLFEALTSSSGSRLHFLIYEKYLRSLDKVIKAAKSALGSSISRLQLAANFQLAEGEIILDVDGSVPTQPVLQHIGMSAWPGRLSLTNNALYFESLGVGLYDKAVRYDLATDMKQVIKPELTGPLGARIFDKAVMYKSTAIEEPVYFEFPEFKGNSRRDYWLDICLEILRAHMFIRKNNFNETQRLEVIARAMLGIFRYRAVREGFHIFSSQYKTLLAFNLAESLPRGDEILETLSRRLTLLNVGGAQHDMAVSPHAKQKLKQSPVAILTLSQLGFVWKTETNLDLEAMVIGDICVGETNPLEIAVKKSVSDTGRVEAAQATVDQVKVEGIDTNVAVMQELLFPIIKIANYVQLRASWEDQFKSTVFMVLTCIAISRGWISYMLAATSVYLAVLMLWRRYFNKGKPLEALKITLPPTKNAVEQLLTLQEAITKVEALIQDGNIVLLKLRALLFAVLPQATDRVALLLVFMAVVFVFLPLRYLIILVFLEPYTREMPYRKESSDKWLRRIREWWFRIPAAPVQLVKLDEKKKKKR
ncbi:uncharacterized protein LOC116128295 [Pistacia vera]|uniref:uncharacterized protein LOC116128295 n=1 Tax=Pistacia vera TaxID=55513 RepID=UPI001262FC5A|nr:uncharacterized protein LOC116128295 [Pistacia vera]XP_031269864.1 uncharacterized protein LOC116128295 [Pistacia vera]